MRTIDLLIYGLSLVLMYYLVWSINIFIVNYRKMPAKREEIPENPEGGRWIFLSGLLAPNGWRVRGEIIGIFLNDGRAMICPVLMEGVRERVRQVTRELKSK